MLIMPEHAAVTARPCLRRVHRAGRKTVPEADRTPMKTLEELRARLDVLDRRLLELVAERQSIGAEIAAVKRSTGQSTRDFRREREVLLKARRDAAALGVSPALAESLLHSLIRGSLTTQEQARVSAQGRGSGRSALVIGGRGKMGRWMADFLASQGFRIAIADPAGEVPGYEWRADWREGELDEDFIVVATPLKVAGTVLEALAARRPRGVVFDVGSLKTPLRSGLAALRAAGARVTSVHPMFGPDTELLSGRHVIFVDLGDAAALEEARGLFGSTMADLVVMGLDEHDRLIAYVLGLSHALNIAFFTALAGSGEAAPRLARMSSTTFDAQLDVAARVAGENPDLYYEIQSLNAYGEESLRALVEAVDRLHRAVREHDPQAFIDMMREGRDYLRVRQAALEPSG
jgi:chorismate mutase/prephenate dehydrogenase